MHNSSDERIDSDEEVARLRRAHSLTHATRGVIFFIKTTKNAWIHLMVFVVMCFLGAYVSLTRDEWLAVLLASALVFVSEAINSAIEIDINLTSPQYHPYARDTKDVAAGAVLIAAVFALIIGLIVFVPYFM